MATYTPTINKIYKMTEFDLLRTKVTMGNMYMCVDTQKLYYDGGNTADDRRLYEYISIRTINELFYQITPAYGKTYYCWEDNSLWVWLNKWQVLYSQTTYPSAYVYDDIPSITNQSELSEIYRYDMPNMPADDNGLLKDGSVVIRDRNRIIKGRLAVSDENDNLLISSFLGGGIRILPNGKMTTEGELYIGSQLNEETEKQEAFATLRAKLSILNDEMYIDYSENPDLDDNKYQNKSHIYKVYHEGNLDTSTIEVMTPLQVYNLLLDTEELPKTFDFNVARLNGHEDTYFAIAQHTHKAEDIDGLYNLVVQQSGVAVRSIFNNMNGVGISGHYDAVTETLSLEANNFQISLTGGITGRGQVQGLSNTVIETTVDPDKHTHKDYVDKMSSLQAQIDAIVVDTNTTYTKDVIDSKIEKITGTSIPTAGKPLLVNANRILPGTAANSKQFDHNITLSLTGGVTGTTTFNGSEETIDIETTFDVNNPELSNVIDNKLNSKCYIGVIGDDISQSYMLVHNLNSKNVIVQFRDNETGEQIYLSNLLVDENSIQISSDIVIPQGGVTVLVYKLL